MDLLTFEEWWSEFLRDDRWGPRGEPYAATAHLGRYMRTRDPASRQEFEKELVDLIRTRSPGWHMAAYALEEEASNAACDDLAGMVRDVNRHTLKDEAYEASVIRVLARRGVRLEQDVRSFLLAKPIGRYWTLVPWALWPEYPNLFAEAHARYFSQVAPASLRKTAVLQAFLAEPAAIQAARDALASSGRTAVWKELRKALRETRAGERGGEPGDRLDAALA